jgi:UDP-N-acetylmuramoyl-L-alanyl-D-glutamate--2,6-diaminopimelate ligase
MKLHYLIKDISPIDIIGDLDKDIINVVFDSRKVEDGSLFICIEGLKTDGHKYIDKAINNGAVAILINKELEVYHKGISYIRVFKSREAMSYIAATFYNYPLKKLKLIGVTGTNGKTTTTYLIKGILEKSGYKTGLIGTIKNIIGDDKFLPASRTTPESLDLYSLFSKMLEEGVSHVVMEVSSHALDLKRVYGMDFEVAVFTNISQDHLDYHKSIDEYLNTKLDLFRNLKDSSYAIINSDDKHSAQVIEVAAGKIYTYGINNNSDIKAEIYEITPHGAFFEVRGGLNFDISLKLTGLFNIYNALAAVTTANVLGISPEYIKSGLEEINGIPGRFELINEGQNFSVIVDYAHTPDGMENVLLTALEFVKGDIIVVFGCGGDRDKEKRPLMGQVGAKYADYCILTSDNPRSEDPGEIIKDIEFGILNMEAPSSYEIIIDRRKAIFRAINKAKKNDMVIIFGKGHETYQIFREKIIAFDDREVADEALRIYLEGDFK